MPDNIEVKIGKLETKLDYVITEIKDLKDNFAHRLDKLEEEMDRMENELKWVTNRVWLAVGAVAVLEPMIMALLIKLINRSG